MASSSIRLLQPCSGLFLHTRNGLQGSSKTRVRYLVASVSSARPHTSTWPHAQKRQSLDRLWRILLVEPALSVVGAICLSPPSATRCLAQCLTTLSDDKPRRALSSTANQGLGKLNPISDCGDCVSTFFSARSFCIRATPLRSEVELQLVQFDNKWKKK
jgi:hypothetical protein